jgi:hypothetical protein
VEGESSSTQRKICPNASLSIINESPVTELSALCRKRALTWHWKICSVSTAGIFLKNLNIKCSHIIT